MAPGIFGFITVLIMIMGGGWLTEMTASISPKTGDLDFLRNSETLFREMGRFYFDLREIRAVSSVTFLNGVISSK
jgi:hypothetical protein